MDKKTQKEEPSDTQENSDKASDETITIDFQQADELVGQKLEDRFLIEKNLTKAGADSGGIGLVYLAKDLKMMGKETVVKILQKAVIENPDILRKFQHEKEALIRLDHPNIVRILDSGTLSDGNPFMVMEYIAGYSLRRVLSERKPLSLTFCAHVIESVTRGLAAAHAEKILHRDIKPENIMITPQPGEEVERVRVIDFGIARLENPKLAPSTEVERAIGTIRYMPPEQLLGKLNQTPAADIYSVAIVTYEMLMGEQPFKPRSIAEMYELQKTVETFLPGQFRISIPEEVRSLLLQALSFDPADRPQDIRKFGKDLVDTLWQGGSPNQPKYSNNIDPDSSLITDTSMRTKTNLTIPVKSSGFETPFTEIENDVSRSKVPLYLGLGLLILLTAGSLIGIAYWKSSDDSLTTNIPKTNTNSNNEPVVLPLRKLSYYFNVQKYRGGKPMGEPFYSSGRDSFENGYKIQLNFNSSSDGYFYLFNEGKDEKGKTNYNLLYPVTQSGRDSARIEKDRNIQTGLITLSGQPGTEKVWIVWTQTRQSVLEEAITEAFNQKGEIVNSETLKALLNFLEENSKQQLNVEPQASDEKERTILSSERDKIVRLLEIEHH